MNIKIYNKCNNKIQIYIIKHNNKFSNKSNRKCSNKYSNKYNKQVIFNNKR